jgi:outer membrane protein assembly factor BamB
MSGFGGPALAAQVGGNRLWHHPRAKQRIGSGVIHDGHLYIHTDPGVAECFELATGNLVWEEPLKRQKNWSSVLLAGGNCYTITQAGDCFVFKAAPRFELVAVNPLGEPSNSSIVPSDGSLFIRTHKALWRIGR